MERANWTGVGVVFGRSGFQEAIRRDELGQAGVCLLFDRPKVCIGEGDPVAERLKSHYSDSKKAFRECAVVFSAKDNESEQGAYPVSGKSAVFSPSDGRNAAQVSRSPTVQLPSEL